MTEFSIASQDRIVKALLIASRSTSPSMGLELSAASARDLHESAVLRSIASRLSKGGRLSEAITEADFLPFHLQAAVEAGEVAENLPASLASVHRAIRRHSDISGRLDSTLSYPRTVFGIFFLILPMVLHILIKFSKNVIEFTSGETVSPFIVFLAGLPITVPIGVLLIGIFIAWQFLSRESTLMKSLKTNYFKIPFLCGIYHLHTLSVFCSTMGLLVRHGLPFDEALRAASAGAPPRVAGVIEAAAESARAGTPPADCFNGGGEFPPTFSWYMRTSSEDGLADTFDDLADYYEQDMKGYGDYLAPILEVGIILFVGLVVGGTVITSFQSIVRLLKFVN